MDPMDLSKYNAYLVPNPDGDYESIIKYLSDIINDRSILDEQKQDIRKQFDEIVRIKNTTMKPPTVVLIPKDINPDIHNKLKQFQLYNK